MTRAFLAGEAGVIRARGDAVGDQALGHALGGLAAGAIDDAALAGACAQEGEHLIVGLGARDDAVGEIRAVEAGGVATGLAEVQLFHDVGLHALGGGGSEGHDGDVRQFGAQAGELAVLGTEIVTPFADAMRFVDGQLGDVPGAEVLDKAGEHEALGGGVEEAVFAPVQAAEAGARFVAIEGGIEEGGRDAGGGEGVDLVLHQGNEGGDDDGEAFAEERGKLDAEGFATAGGQQGEDVASGEGVGDDLLLQGTEGVVAEGLL